MNTQELLKKISSGGYDTAVGARRATGRVKMSAEDRVKVDRAINKQFGITAAPATKEPKGTKKATSKKAPPRAEKAVKRKPSAGKDHSAEIPAPELGVGQSMMQRQFMQAQLQAELRSLQTFSEILEMQVNIIAAVGTPHPDTSNGIIATAEGVIRKLQQLDKEYKITELQSAAAEEPETLKDVTEEPEDSTPPDDTDWSQPMNGASNTAHA